MELTKVGSALSNRTRVRLLQLLSEQSHSTQSACEEYNDKYSDSKHRESIYRGLEKLVESGLVRKEYESENKRLEYTLRVESLYVDLEKATVHEAEDNGQTSLSER